ncbi:hypothetical protein DU19_0477 [Chlamydia muridarum]|nr:hypothetical protein DU17_0479 [Chlamydia muridarum]KDU81441.1 hypothetical protein DU18_0479 [Chlamydia muridarum]KDU82490.1 hypothetical protein DU19_0477 [Chlamydia muridarum]KDU83393.1 hypothetical protein DU20_0477 [Chlamydia muridarum]KDU84764.1 hypothetical protein DU21_0479 [Chlamydia muridarum]
MHQNYCLKQSSYSSPKQLAKHCSAFDMYSLIVPTFSKNQDLF